MTRSDDKIKQKRILFLSGIDFKQRSIQVIRITPEGYAAAGWDVTYLVLRDSSPSSDYFYEKPYNPDGLEVHRQDYPYSAMRRRLASKRIDRFLQKLSVLSAPVKLARIAKKTIKKNDFDVLYGYEVCGIISAKILRIVSRSARRMRFVRRFQGTKLCTSFDVRKPFHLVRHADQVLAFLGTSDLSILTDDGTNAYRVFRVLGRPRQKCLVLINGIDFAVPSSAEIQEARRLIREPRGINSTDRLLLAVSRMVGWKRVDRVIDLFETVLQESGGLSGWRLILVGDGASRAKYEAKVKAKGLAAYVEFVGAVSHDKVYMFYQSADIFISLYSLSNFGNPLLEAIMTGLPVVTLSNGGTRRVVKHGVNGLVYDEEDFDLKAIARDLIRLSSNDSWRENAIQKNEEISRRYLKGWEDRIRSEVMAVETVIDSDYEQCRSSRF